MAATSPPSRPPRRRSQWDSATWRLTLALAFVWIVPFVLVGVVSGTTTILDTITGAFPSEDGAMMVLMLLALAFSSVATIFLARRFQQNDARLAPWLCPSCGYDMRGRGVDAAAPVCPECGARWEPTGAGNSANDN